MTEFDKLFHDNLKDGKAETPPFVWDNIENEIEADKRKKGAFFFFWTLGVFAILLSLGLFYWGMGGLFQQVYSTENVLTNSTSKAVVGNELSRVEEEKENGRSNVAVGNELSRVEEEKENGRSNVAAGNELSRVEEKKENGRSNVAVGNELSRVEEKKENHISNVATDNELSRVEEKKKNSTSKSAVENKLSTDKVRIITDSSTLLESENVILLLAEEVLLEKVQEKNKSKNKFEKTSFFIEAKVGYSSYKMSLWNSSFVFGDLSIRKFKSSGVNANISFGYQMSAWLNPMIGFSYNKKQSEFKYNALYDDQGYFNYDIQGNEMPLDEINDSDFLCNQYILYDIEAVFNITSFSLTLGNRFNLLQLKRIGIDLDLSYNLELTSRVDVTSISKIDVSKNLVEMFNSKVAVGLNLNYQLSRQFKLFIHAEYIFTPYNSTNFQRSDTHELINSIGLRFNF
jgi:hypothetical protein